MTRLKDVRKARCVAVALLLGDTVAAGQFGVSASSVKRWTKRHETDHEFGSLVARALVELDGDWSAEVDAAYRATVRKIHETIQNAEPSIRHLPDFLSAARVLSETLVAHNALVTDGDPREGGVAEAAAKADSGTTSTVH
jgi:hypothetical protein